MKMVYVYAMPKYQLVITTCMLFLLAGCASMKPAAFANGQPKLDPVGFFGGHTRSAGVIETPGGKPSTRITTETEGKLKDSVLSIEQNLYPEGKKKNHRLFVLHQIDEHHVDATADDIVGTAHGLLYGNQFSWTFRHTLINRKFIRHVRMTQYMYLMPDGKTLIIRSIVRKFGFVLAQITEQFQKY
jgi:Protein of unknown function (DUF3833)